MMPLWLSSLVEVERPIILPLIETRLDGENPMQGSLLSKMSVGV